jgi:hypothetical protein
LEKWGELIIPPNYRAKRFFLSIIGYNYFIMVIGVKKEGDR